MTFQKKALSVLVLAAFSMGSYAVGTLGNKSSDDAEIQVAVEKYDGTKGKVMVHGLDDMNLGTFGKASPGGLNAFTNFCIYATGYNAGDQYDPISVKIGGGSDAASGFKLSGPQGVSVDYSVRYKSGKDAGLGGDSKEAGTAGASYTFDKLQSVGISQSGAGYVCNGENASLYVSVKDSDVSQVPEGVYKGTIGVVIEAK